MAHDGAFRDNLHSRVVGWLKIIFPLMALGILSTLFLLSRSVDPTKTIPFAKIDLKERSKGQSMTAPRFSGVSPRGDQISFSATSAQPDPNNTKRAFAEKLSSRIVLKSGTTIDFSADTGVIDDSNDIATLEGSVVMQSSTGYVVHTQEISSGIRTVRSETKGPIQAIGPIGKFSAGKMLLTSDSEGGNTHLVFTKGVKLVYYPKEAPQRPKD